MKLRSNTAQKSLRKNKKTWKKSHKNSDGPQHASFEKLIQRRSEAEFEDVAKVKKCKKHSIKMLKEQIDKFYEAKEESREKEAFWVSDAGKCPRAIWFAMKNYPKKPKEARVQRIFEHGDHTHMRILGALFSLGLVRAVEAELPEQGLLKGRADAIISIAGEPLVVEIKSINAAKFRNEHPDPDHVKQLQLYLYFFKIKRGVLLYENKDTQELKEFLINYDENIAKEVLASFEQLKIKIDQNEIPAIPPDLEEWRCVYCPYVEACQKEEQKLNGNRH